MGIMLSKEDRVELNTKLTTLLKDHETYTPCYVTAITHSLISVLETNSRWVRITTEELQGLSNRYSRKIPPGDFRVTFGKILVRRFGDQISREFFSEDKVIKGWHKELLHDVRSKFGLQCDQGLSTALFELGQYFIIKKKAM